MKKGKKTGPKKQNIGEKVLVNTANNLRDEVERLENSIESKDIKILELMNQTNDYQIEIEKIRKNILHRKIGIFFIGIGIGIILASIKF